ncbi:hypothetical protein IFO70_25215 [Phormidium tenue FACHB-886]|nr:hypothetical protein [Phormidium tenue FACHB-886]
MDLPHWHSSSSLLQLAVGDRVVVFVPVGGFTILMGIPAPSRVPYPPYS